MDELKQLRQEIDTIDHQLVELFCRRMEVARRVGEHKAARAMAVLDQEREREVLRSRGELAGEELRPAVITLYQTILSLSRRRQRDLLGEGRDNPGVYRWQTARENARTPVEAPRVVYQGAPGAYSEQAAADFFGDGVCAVGLEQFEDCFTALKEGEADYAVVPIENSSTGAIRQIYDLLTRYEYFVVGETAVRVEHCLMAPKGATLDTITHVYSHEQGLFQCERYLSAHPGWHCVPQADTAGSARMVAQLGDISRAAVCAERAARLYGLEILERGINHNSRNTTRFVVVSPRMELREGADKISTVFRLPHQAGALHQILTIFAVYGLNVVRLESRPVPERSWEYMFFLEFNGHADEEVTAAVLHELAQTTGEFRVLGNFRSNLN